MASKHYHFKFNFDHDREIIDRIESKENKNDYIRSLVWSDIAADILRDSIKLGDQEQDPEEIRNHERVDFYNDHCPALNNLDPNINNCDDCEYNVHYTDVDGIVKAACSLEDEWRKHWNHVLYKAVGGADRDYPAEFKGLKKAQLNSLYGRMIKDPFKEDVINNMIDDSNASNVLKSELSVEEDGSDG